jgi:site-specific DNA-cytosine methylase
MNVLSLFDGMSCGQQALNRAGFKIDNYFASEIDKHAIVVTMANYPETVQLGSVVDVNGYDLPKIDLLIGGSPCQSFSFAGKRKGMSTKDEQQILTLNHYLELKKEGFEFEGQSYLFWEYMRLLNEIRSKNPNVFFLLENVMMSENWERVLSGAIGVHPIEINSALVSAQNRRRLYWTNIGLEPAGLFGDLESIIQQPKDKGILLKDVLQDNPNAKYYLSDKILKSISNYNFSENQFDNSGKSMCLCSSYYKMGRDNQFVCESVPEKYFLSDKAIIKIEKSNNSERAFDDSEKSLCLKAGYHKIGFDNQFVCEPVPEKYFLSDKTLNYFIENTKKIQQIGGGWKFEPTEGDKKSFTLTTREGNRIENNFIICHSGQRRSENRPSIAKNKNAGGAGPLSRTDGKTYCLDHTSFANFVEQTKVVPMDFRHDEGFRIHEDGKTGTLRARARNDESCGQLTQVNKRIRRLTPIECERLQTVPDNYTNHVSDTQRYRMLGNGWTVDVIVHLLNYLPKNYKK